MKNWIRSFYLLCVGMAAAGCASVGIAGDHIRWTEEVKQSDGKVIQIQRHVELTVSGFPVQQRGFDKYQEICYPPMGIRWKSKAGYQPDIFDIVDGKAYMHVPIYDCFQCMLHQYPETDAMYFVWDHGHWKRIKHEEFPATSEWNLLMQTKGGTKDYDPDGLVTLTRKTSGLTDSSLRYEQQRKGWKRTNEGGKGVGRCNACRSIKTTTDATPEVFINDGKSSCQP